MSEVLCRFAYKTGKLSRGKIVKLETSDKSLYDRILNRLSEENVDFKRFRVLWMNNSLNAFTIADEIAPNEKDGVKNGIIDCVLEERPSYSEQHGYKISQQKDDDGFFGICMLRDHREDGHAVVWRVGAQLGASFFADIGKR